MTRLVLIGALAAAATVTTVAAAATLGITGPALGAGDVAVAGCDGDGFTVGYTTSGGNVTTVTVGGIADPGCEGGTLRVTVTNSSGASIASGSASIPADGDTSDNAVPVSVSPQPAAEQPTAVELSIEGP